MCRAQLIPQLGQALFGTRLCFPGPDHQRIRRYGRAGEGSLQVSAACLNEGLLHAGPLHFGIHQALGDLRQLPVGGKVLSPGQQSMALAIVL